MTRTDLIAEIADDIACGHSAGKWDAGFFLDTLMDDRRVTADDVAVLLTQNEFSDAHINVSDRLRKLVESEAVDFFTNSEKGQDYVSDKLAEAERDRKADEAYERSAA